MCILLQKRGFTFTFSPLKSRVPLLEMTSILLRAYSILLLKRHA